MTRSGNRTPPEPPGVILYFEPHEIGALQFNTPGPSGVLGGYAKAENFLLESIDQATGRCVLDAIHFERMVRYCLNYSDGGPNRRIRTACIPALSRAGINIKPPGAGA